MSLVIPPPALPAAPLLELEQFSVQFPGQPAPTVKELSLTLHAAEKFALVGESGSGKSVTAQSIMRLLPAQLSGSVRWQGQELLTYNERQMRRLRGKQIAMVFQEPMSALNPLMTIGQQIAEVLEKHEALSRTDAWARALALLERTGIPAAAQRLRHYPHQLSGGQRQRAMIAMALACRPQLLIADEPTTALDVTIRAQIMSLLEELQAEYGMAILLITHDLNLVKNFATRVGVMQQGQLRELASTQSLFANPQHPYTAELLAAQPSRLIEEDRVTHPAPPPLLVTEALSVSFSSAAGWFKRKTECAVDAVDLHIPPQRTLGLVGESGSGKTTLAMALLGLQATSGGRTQFDGQYLDQLDKAAQKKYRAKLQVVFQDPFSALSPRMTIEQIVGEGLQLHHPELSQVACRERVSETLAEVGLSPDALYRYPHEFSGGQRQRIAIARAIILRPSLIVLDEPTSALDVSVQKQVLRLLVTLQQKYGTSYLFISHDLAVIRAIAHEVIVMHKGKIVERGATETIFTQPLHPYTQSLIHAAMR
ncbi:ABC transporter ATP-binding protein [Parvibium lacunae]|uniref:ABC transporter ATP-binding protein n=1 Tax=Parvibium lacunae TaxID=1888893 RepID=A0A368L6K2_9BURK|nr:dipeptide ABC transporter ATP-binding protein [Parvibium lacunae]RCS59283.1 ABC transporter ATP-binding protein [Parvibium lacunae]